MSVKRKRVVLSLQTKNEIINRLEHGETITKLADEYGIGKSTICGMRKKKCEIRDCVENLSCNKIHKSMKFADNIHLDMAVFKWFYLKRQNAEPLSGPIICEKALQFNQKLEGTPCFKASSGWLPKFASRHGIRGINMSDEKLSADTSAADAFKQKFVDLLTKENYHLDNVYNADETGLLWKSLPRKTLVCSYETSAPGYKTNKNRITALVCGNASDNHKLPILLIGKSKKSRCLKNVNLPIVYMNQKNASMDTKIFIEWFTNVFVPIVKKRQLENGSRQKTLLLLDNATCHSSHDILNKVEKFIKVIFLPLNVTPLIQPMDQGVMESFKRNYKKHLLRKFVLRCDDSEVNLLNVYKSFDMKDCSYLVANAWHDVKNTTLEKGWYQLLSNTEVHEEPDNNEIDEMLTALYNIPGCRNSDKSVVIEWLNSDKINDMSDNEIVEQVNEWNMSNENENNVEEIEEENESNNDSNSIPTHSEAFVALETSLRWFEVQTESTAGEIMTLKKIAQLAAQKDWETGMDIENC